MNTCDTCKWWGENDFHSEDDVFARYRECVHDKMFPDYDSPNFDKLLESGDCLVDVGNDAGYQSLYTGPKFGCIHHEPK